MPAKKAKPEADEKKEVKQMAETTSPSSEKDSNLMAAVGYIIGIVAIILYFIKKDDKFVKFHALQSIMYMVVLFVIVTGLNIVALLFSLGGGGVVGIIISLLTLPLGGLYFLYALYLAYMAFQGKMYKIPVLGNFVEKYV